MINLDGASGEGGGQILRTALSLSLLTQTPFRIENIRAGREKPGLLRQHLTGVRAAAEISGSEVEGDELGSRTVTFRPGTVKPDTYTFAIGTAGSANLVLQTVLLPLLYADGKSKIKLDGGTHNSMSPPFHFLERVFLPLLGRMGAKVELELVKWGFYPAGGGRIVADVKPGKLTAIHLPARGALQKMRIVGVVSALPEDVARREITTACLALGRARGEGRVIAVPDPVGPGNVMWVEAECEHITELFTGFGEKGLRAESVATRLSEEVKSWLAADVPVDEHLADQLLLPMALAGGGSFRTTRPSPHTTTNVETIQKFLDVPIAITEEDGAFMVRVG